MGLRGVEVFEPYGISPAIMMAYNNETLRASLIGYDEMVALLARPDCNEGYRLYFIWRDSHLVEASCAAVAQPQQRVCLW